MPTDLRRPCTPSRGRASAVLARAWTNALAPVLGARPRSGAPGRRISRCLPLTPPHRPLRWGVLGAAWIADRALLPALRDAHGSELLAIGARDPARASELAARHGVPRVHADYTAVL